jgi:uncharacterized protein YndB with AHSA1/START domain
MPDDRPIADGTVEQGPDGSTQVRFVRRLPHPVERVWEALTDPAELRKWWGDVDLDLVDGGRFALRWLNTDEDGNAATLDGTVSKLDPPRLLAISAAWGSTGTDDPGTQTTLTWELDPDGDHTLLRFTNTVAAPPGEAGPPGTGAADTRTAAGWHLHLDALAVVLSGGQVDIAHPEPHFEPIHQAYSEKYGSTQRPEAGRGRGGGPGSGGVEERGEDVGFTS